jgi:hypothetical protein
MKRHIHTYEEMKRVGKKYYNDKGFCGVIAVAAACQTSFGKAFAQLNKSGRDARRGSSLEALTTAATTLGCTVERCTFTGSTFASVYKYLPKEGVYWIMMRGHISCVDDGVIIDWCKANRRFKVIRVYKLERNF